MEMKAVIAKFANFLYFLTPECMQYINTSPIPQMTVRQLLWAP